MRGSAAESTATRGSLRWISRIASTPSLTTVARMPQPRSASSRSLPASASGMPISTRSPSSASGRATGSRAGGAAARLGATFAAGLGRGGAGSATGTSARSGASEPASSGGRTRNTASHLAQRSRTPSGRSFSFSIR